MTKKVKDVIRNKNYTERPISPDGIPSPPMESMEISYAEMRSIVEQQRMEYAAWLRRRQIEQEELLSRAQAQRYISPVRNYSNQTSVSIPIQEPITAARVDGLENIGYHTSSTWGRRRR